MEQITLGEFIEELEKINSQSEEDKPSDGMLFFDFCHTVPLGVESYRGYYEQLAISWGGGDHYNRVKGLGLESFLKELNSAVGASFSGWKGGDYIMGLDTPLWVANSGCTGDTAIVGVKSIGWAIIIQTEYQEQ